ncbi:hypothetical protein SAMN06893097_101460 [Geodermatophilus sabuli]|uniref:Uncharacterized protein n=1 Tax=Geodermatophilus sabuli TaxID=1564158 RepID=A0A285E722_9ACTN|nr:hypothetical protein SAMN06893097_101460 [Geodermatophilus sabuli]
MWREAYDVAERALPPRSEHLVRTPTGQGSCG